MRRERIARGPAAPPRSWPPARLTAACPTAAGAQRKRQPQCTQASAQHARYAGGLTSTKEMNYAFGQRRPCSKDQLGVALFFLGGQQPRRPQDGQGIQFVPNTSPTSL